MEKFCIFCLFQVFIFGNFEEYGFQIIKIANSVSENGNIVEK